MLHPMISLALAHARHDDLMRELNSPEGRMRAEQSGDNRPRRRRRLGSRRS